MKKKYITPSTIWVSVKAGPMLAGSANGSVASGSMAKEEEETMSSRRGLFFDDDDMD